VLAILKEAFMTLEELVDYLYKNKMNLEINQKTEGMKFVCGYLFRNGKTKSLDLAKALGVSTARIAAILNNLCGKDLVYREKSDVDKRLTFIDLTNKGYQVMVKRDKALRQFIKKTFDEFGSEKIDEFIKMIRRIDEMYEEVDFCDNDF